jgi:hypothetical protein
VKLFRAILFFAPAALAPAKIFACAACGSGNSQIIDSPMVDGMNLGILTLGAVLLTVLGAALTLLIYFIRKSEALNAAAELKNSPEATKA